MFRFREHALLPFMILALNHREEHVAAQIWRLQHAAYRAEAALIGIAELPPLQETIADIGRLEETFYGMIGEDDELIAALSLGMADGDVVICRVMVHPDRFRQGLARRLLLHVERLHATADSFRVSAATNNIPAVRLYTSLGYEPVHSWSPMPGLTMAEYVKKQERKGAE